MPAIELSFEPLAASFSPRRFEVRERLSEPFHIEVTACSEDPAVDLAAFIGQPVRLRVRPGWAHTRRGGARSWSGLCRAVEQVAVEPRGLSTYRFTIVPTLWLLGERRNYRIFQHVSVPGIVTELLEEWGITHELRIVRADYPTHEYKVQYGESDLAFVERLLEEVGIAYAFVEEDSGASKLMLADALHHQAPREGAPIPVADNPSRAAEREFATALRFGHELREQALVISDYELRKPQHELRAIAGEAGSGSRERHVYRPGSFLAERVDGTRHLQETGDFLAQRALEAARAGRRAISFETNAIDLCPGAIFQLSGAAHPEISGSTGEPQSLLTTGLDIVGTPVEEWRTVVLATAADEPHRPAQRTPRPRIRSVQSATVVGPRDQEIHVDEFGRVRVQFPWDRYGRSDDQSSCWVRVAEGWAGAGSGASSLPRIGQEVLVAFADGNPDQPFVVGRLFNRTQPVAYPLPDRKTESGWRTQASPGTGGWSEIRFDDAAGRELVSVQAQRDQRVLVKHDEVITVAGHRDKRVATNETETTLGERFQTTVGDRESRTLQSVTTHVVKGLDKLVAEDQDERVEGNQLQYVGADREIDVQKSRRELVDGSSHLRVQGDRREQVDGTHSMTSASALTEARSYAVDAGGDLQMTASNVVIEGADITVNARGNYVRLDGGGVIISGTLVKINEGGAPGDVVPAQFIAPTRPEEPAPVQTTDAKIKIIEIEPVGRKGPVVVGERVRLKAVDGNGRPVVGASWDVGGSRLADYRQKIEYVGEGGDTRATSSNAEITFLHPPEAGVKPGDSPQDSVGEEIAFYWIEKGKHTVAVKLGGTVVASKEFTVEAPTFSVKVETGKVGVGEAGDGRDKIRVVQCGDPTKVPGIRYIYEATAPARGDGEIAAVVLVTSHRKLSFDDGSETCSSTGRFVLERWLDAFLPTDRQAPLKQRQTFHAQTPVDVGAGKKASWTMQDTPASQLGKLGKGPRTPLLLDIEEDFQVYFMYRPSGLDGARKRDEHSIWVTLARYEWSWSAKIDPMTEVFIAPPTHPYFAPYLVVPTSIAPTWVRVLLRDHDHEPCRH